MKERRVARLKSALAHRKREADDRRVAEDVLRLLTHLREVQLGMTRPPEPTGHYRPEPANERFQGRAG